MNGDKSGSNRPAKKDDGKRASRQNRNGSSAPKKKDERAERLIPRTTVGSFGKSWRAISTHKDFGSVRAELERIGKNGLVNFAKIIRDDRGYTLEIEWKECTK